MTSHAVTKVFKLVARAKILVTLISCSMQERRNKVSKVTHAFICNGGATVQGEG